MIREREREKIRRKIDSSKCICKSIMTKAKHNLKEKKKKKKGEVRTVEGEEG